MTGRPLNIAIVGKASSPRRAPAPTLVLQGTSRAWSPRSVVPKERVQAYGRRHGVADTYVDYARVLERPDIDVVDLCVPNYLHRPMTEAAAQAGKHVICSKPLTAFDGSGLAANREPSSVPKAEMLAAAAENAAAMVEATRRAGVLLMYAENWVYAPSIAKADRLAAASGGAILEMRGGECHSGSHSPYSKEWRTAGGGALLRPGVHPIGAMLHLKRQERLRRWGRPIRPSAVIAEVGDLTRTPGFCMNATSPATQRSNVSDWPPGDGVLGNIALARPIRRQRECLLDRGLVEIVIAEAVPRHPRPGGPIALAGRWRC